MAIWVVVAVICLVNLALGAYLGKNGIVRTFGDPSNSFRIPLLLLAFLPAPLLLWLQESRGYVASPEHIGLVFVAFGLGFLLGRTARQ